MELEHYPDRRALEEDYSRHFAAYNGVLEAFQQELQQLLTALEIRVTIKHRVKSVDSYYRKVLSRLKAEKETGREIPIHDLIAMRIVCPFLDDLHTVEALLRSNYVIREVERKGADHSFREFGYNSTHLVVEIPGHLLQRFPDLELQTLEVQLRTILQDAWAEVEHELVYKRRITPLDEPMRRKLAALNANLTLSDLIFQEIREYQLRLHDELEKRRSSFMSQLNKEEAGRISRKDAKRDPTVPDAKADVLNAKSKDDLLLKALHAHNLEDYSQAIEIYSEFLTHDIDPRISAAVLIHRGMAHFSRTDYQDALQDFRLATERQPDNSRAFYHLGVVNRVLGDSTAALGALRKSVELSPYAFHGLFELAKTLYGAGNHAEALEYCEKALKINPDSAQVRELRTQVSSHLGS